MPALAMIEHLAGMQAQEPKDPYVALWSRIEGFQPAELEALLLDRRAVRAVLMRSTVHLASIDDALAFRPGRSSPCWTASCSGTGLERRPRGGRSRAGPRPRTAAARGAAAVAGRAARRDGRALSRPEPDEPRLRLPGPAADPPGAAAGLWSRSGQVKLTTLDHWSGRPLGTDTAPDAMILRYLAAFGPASTADAGNWSRLTGLKAAMERLRPRLVTYRDEKGRELFDLPGAPIADPDVTAPVRFFPVLRQRLPRVHQDRCIVPASMKAAPVRTPIAVSAFAVDGFGTGFWWTSGRPRRDDDDRADAAAVDRRATPRRGRGAPAAGVPRERRQAGARPDPLVERGDLGGSRR